MDSLRVILTDEFIREVSGPGYTPRGQLVSVRHETPAIYILNPITWQNCHFTICGAKFIGNGGFSYYYDFGQLHRLNGRDFILEAIALPKARIGRHIPPSIIRPI